LVTGIVLSSLLAVAVAAASAPLEAQVVGVWTTRRPLNSLRTEVGGATLLGRVHVVGAFPGSTGGPGIHEAYDPVTDTWATLAPLPEHLNHVGAVVVGDKLYVVGGWTQNILPSATLYRYDPMSDQWTILAPMPTARASPATVAYHDRIYVIGGNTANGGFGEIGVVEAYDIATNSWIQNLAPLPTPRDHAMYGMLGTRIHVVGGRARDFGGAMTTHEAYSPAANSWIQRAPLPTGRSGGAATVFQGRLHVLGGEFGPGGTQDTHEAYDANTDSWASLPPMPSARHGLAVAAVGGTLFAASGGPTPGASYGNKLEAYTPTSTCTPRPQITVRASLVGPGRLAAQIGSTTPPHLPGNRLVRIQVTGVSNAAADVRSLIDQRQPFTLELSDRPAALQVIVRRLTPGHFSARLVVHDDCGSWPTFVGGGAAVP